MDEVLNEMYFGKVPELLIAENLLNEIKEKCMRVKPFFEFSIDDKVFKKLKNDEIWIKLGNTLCKLFGFKAASVELLKPAVLSIGNAFTYIALGSKEDSLSVLEKKGKNIKEIKDKYKIDDIIGKSIVVTNKGFHIDSTKFPAILITFISLDWFFKENFTGAHILSILLHEIGHNFTRLILPIRGFNHFQTRIDERFADRFVAMYGYSKEYIEFQREIPNLISVIRPLNFIINNIPILNLYVLWYFTMIIFWKLPFNLLNPVVSRFDKVFRFLLTIIDAHPIMKTRMESQLEQLESDLKMQNLSPAMRKEIQLKIKETKKAMNDTTKYDGSVTGLGPYFLNIYAYFIEPIAPIDWIWDNYCKEYDTANKVNRKLDRIYKGDRYNEKGEKITNGGR